MRNLIPALCVVCAVAGCDGGTAGDTGAVSNLRPADSPDIVLLSVAGHDGALNALFCVSSSNRAYLGDPGEAVEALTDLFSSLGLTAAVADFSDRFDGPDLDGDGVVDVPDRLGFLQLLETLQAVFDNWISGFDNPTRIVIVAHSHGATWAHIATSVMSHVPVEYLVTLDGICFLWECEHQSDIGDFYQQNGNPYSWDISLPCETWQVAGQPVLFNTKDIAFDNVAVNLEVQSDSFTADCCNNYRLDGTRDGINTFFAASEGHNDVRLAGRTAMEWVRNTILALEATGP